MSDHRERSCRECGSLLHHEDICPRKDRVPLPLTKLAAQIRFLRENFRNDGAEGETVHAVADAAEKLAAADSMVLSPGLWTTPPRPRR